MDGASPVRRLSSEERCDFEGNAIYRANRETRRVEVRQNLGNIAYLSTLGQETTFVCPCGKYTGIKFVDNNGNAIVENMYPMEWWVKQSRLAHFEHRLGLLLVKTNLSDYLSGYNIG
jgi:hypothetical protein